MKRRTILHLDEWIVMVRRRKLEEGEKKEGERGTRKGRGEVEARRERRDQDIDTIDRAERG